MRCQTRLPGKAQSAAYGQVQQVLPELRRYRNMPLSPARHANYINLADYCKIDGSTDDSIGFTTAYTLASSLGMGLFHPGGTLVKGNDTLLPTVPIIGAG